MSYKQDTVDGLQRSLSAQQVRQMDFEEFSADEDMDYKNVKNIAKTKSKSGKTKTKPGTRKSNRKTVKTEYYESE